jgi:hypothetical protein
MPCSVPRSSRPPNDWGCAGASSPPSSAPARHQSPASGSRAGSTRSASDPKCKEGELALLFLRAYRSLDALVGGDDAKARLWLRADNDHISGVPAERIRTVEGLVDVVQYLDAMRGRL